MNDSERPEFPAHFEAQIEAAQIHVDKYYWGVLRELQVPISEMEHDAPPEPKRPNMLRMVIAAYARNLYLAEGMRYPDDPSLAAKLNGITERLVGRVLGTITRMERIGKRRGVTLAQHGLDEPEMRHAALNELEKIIENRLTPPPPASLLLPPEIQAQLAGTTPMRSVATPQSAKSKPAAQHRMPSTIDSPSAARKIEAYMNVKGLSQTEFAIQAGTTDKTIRKLRRTGKVRRSLLAGIASAIGLSKEDLLA